MYRQELEEGYLIPVMSSGFVLLGEDADGSQAEVERGSLNFGSAGQED